MTESIVEVRNLRKSYGKIEALKGVSFEVRKGEVFTLIFSKDLFLQKCIKE